MSVIPCASSWWWPIRVRGYIDFAHETGGASRKLERSRRKKAEADRLRPRIGEMFDAEVTGVSESGTYVRLIDGSAEGRVVRGYKPLSVGMKVPVKLVNTDSVHGFIDFEFTQGVDPAKEERRARKRAAALSLRDRVGESVPRRRIRDITQGDVVANPARQKSRDASCEDDAA